MIRPSSPRGGDFEADLPDDADESQPLVPRLFVREPGWRVGHKATSEREFCSNIAPGEDIHHRLGQGELYVASGDERLCLPCADRRGLLDFGPKVLRPPMARHTVAAEVGSGDTIPVVDRDGVRPTDEFEPPSVRE